MAATAKGIFGQELQNAIAGSKVLVVGAGGIGCEILKNLAMSGFPDIEIIDLDTIDVSNLNRQFLFRREHVGKSKAAIACETALSFNSNIKIAYHHDNIMQSDYGLQYFQQFTFVMNALDNRAARNHVNRMCLAADVPLIESGTAGYDGQVELIKKSMTQCYECIPKVAQKTFPGCTIRNTPSEPIHCIVWAKHLFNQLFGEEDPDHDVSPDTADPEAAGDTAGESALQAEVNDKGNVERVSTRSWAQKCNYDAEKLFTKLFHDDIKYLLSMGNLWKKRRAPTPLSWKNLPDEVAGCSKDDTSGGLKDQQQWSVAKCAAIFAESINKLSQTLADSKKLKQDDHLVWDKDDQNSMDFVASCANIRAHIFGIPPKTRFDIKSMAGNIIPAIATTNAIIAGVVVLFAFRVLLNKLEECKSVYLRPKMNHRNQLLVPEKCINPPNPKCYVCAKQPTAVLAVDVTKMTVKQFNDIVLKQGLNVVAPDVMIDGKGVVVISSDDDEMSDNDDKVLKEVGIHNGCILSVDDFLQNYSLKVTIVHRDKPAVNSQEPEFIISADAEDLKPKEEPKLDEVPSTSNGQRASSPSAAEAKKRKTDAAEKDTPSKKRKVEDENVVDSDDDISIVEQLKVESNSDSHFVSPSKQKLINSRDDDDCFIVEDDHDLLMQVAE
ncbi:SUMO-activating enzyme subunit 2 [Copidosoma floridanum]|uniref:SUMO-activating enzyme subunit 2 n=1 Tax=Copidosoma floridanum TaxID=29053 RepID=UPI0006C9BB57|nr:SUMO-activating enzyme subunit 2 [Copidosoma floridanum]